MYSDSKRSKIGRRSFLSGAAAAGTTSVLSASSYARVIGANDRISIGVIGCGGRGNDLMKQMLPFKDAENFTINAVCDVWKTNRNKGGIWVKNNFGRRPKMYSRYSDMIENNDVDAVMITSPDHTHCPILIEASDMGKDVLVEKPLAMHMDEARAAVDTVRKNKTICQVGTQRRSDGRYMSAAKYIQGGNLGKVISADLKWNDNSPRWNKDFSDVKAEDLDWEGFLINAEKRPFDPRRYRSWHLYRDYSLGPIAVLGAHLTDLISWYLETGCPEKAVAFGDRIVWKDREQYDTIIATFKYPNFIATCEHRLGNGSMRSEAVFYGTQGTLTATEISTEGRVDPKRIAATGDIFVNSPLAATEDGEKKVTIESDPKNIHHCVDWIRAMRERRDPNATVEDGYIHSVVSMMGQWAAEKGKCLAYDETIKDIVEA